MSSKCTALAPGFPGSVSHIRGVGREESEMVLTQAQDPKHVLFHSSTSPLLPPGGDMPKASVFSPLPQAFTSVIGV